VAQLAPVQAVAAMAAPLPELEDYFGVKRIAALREVLRARERLDYLLEEAVLTPDGRYPRSLTL
jgi:hypothetical protein